MEQGVPDNWRRVFAGFVALVGLWIVVYWAWPAGEPAITFDAARPAAVQPSGTIPAARTVAAVPPAESPILPAAPRPGGPAPGKAAPIERPDPKPQPRAGVIAPRFTEYTVKSGDTVRSIAQKLLGSEKYADAISRSNPLTDPERLRAGQVLKIPHDPSNIQGRPTPPREARAKPDAPRQAPAPAAATEYVVVKGDTLSGIAKKVYKDGSLGDVIYDANRDRLKSRDAVRVGQRLKIPARSDRRAGS